MASCTTSKSQVWLARNSLGLLEKREKSDVLKKEALETQPQRHLLEIFRMRALRKKHIREP